ncbi:MAG TPA: DUF4374 domain-containing protein [Ohtaekwangia sp.]
MKIYTRRTAFLLALIAAVASSCSSDNEGKSIPEHGYLLGFRTATDPTADYILYETDLASGTVSARGNGIEQGGWSYYAKAGDTYLALDYDNSIAKGYRFKEDGLGLEEVGEFAFERMDCFGKGLNGTAIAIGAPWGGGSYDCKIQIVDGASVSIANSKTTPIYESFYTNDEEETIQLNAWPTATWIKNNKLYVSFYPVIGPTWETPVTDTAYVSVYSYPALEYETTFKDTRTGPVGYYSSQPCVLEDESGDLYTLSSSSFAAGYTQATKPSGILRINSGESEFDEAYFFNVEEEGYRVLGGVYVGNGKVVARVISVTIDNQAPAWAAFSVVDAPIHNIAVLDLEDKTIEIVDEVPLHGGQYLTPFMVENGKVWASITTSATDAFVYEIDPATATAVKGARIDGSEIQTFSKY